MGDELVRLHRAPGRYVGVGRRVVSEHRDHRTQGYVPDLLREHDDGNRALAAEGVDDQGCGRGRHGNRSSFGLYRTNGCGLSGQPVRLAARRGAPEQTSPAPGHAVRPAREHALTLSIMPVPAAGTLAPRKDDANMRGPSCPAHGARYCLHDTL